MDGLTICLLIERMAQSGVGLSGKDHGPEVRYIGLIRVSQTSLGHEFLGVVMARSLHCFIGRRPDYLPSGSCLRPLSLSNGDIVVGT